MGHIHTPTYHSKLVVLSNKMKELNVKNKFRHKLVLGGYKATMPK
jgi:hypothetical protein